LREPEAFASWFQRIILKQADRLTRGKCLASSPLDTVADVAMDGQDPNEIAETNEVREWMHRAICALPERERLVIVLFYGTGYELKEIAAFLDVPVSTVKKRLYDGRKQLKDELINVVRDAC
jgi:RNA polymerase sigma factor (sigma-70 family)